MNVFGSLVISFGGCNDIKEVCYNDILVLQTMREEEIIK